MDSIGSFDDSSDFTLLFTYEISCAVLSPRASFSCMEKDYIIDLGKGLFLYSELMNLSPHLQKIEF